jgi:hypothetical protein
MLVVHMGELIWGFGSGGGWWRSVGWSTCFLVWKNMKCCRFNIEVSIPNVGFAVTGPHVIVPVFVWRLWLDHVKMCSRISNHKAFISLVRRIVAEG